MPDTKGSGGSRAPAGAFGASRPPAGHKPAASEPPAAHGAPQPSAGEQDLAPHTGNPNLTAPPAGSQRPSQAPGDAPLPKRAKHSSRHPTLGGGDSAPPDPTPGPSAVSVDSQKHTLIGRVPSPVAAAADQSPDKATLLGRSSAPAPTPTDDDGSEGEKPTLIGRRSSRPAQQANASSVPPRNPPSTLVGGPVPKTVHEDMIARARSQRGSYPSPPSWDEVRESLAPRFTDSSPPQPRVPSRPPEVAQPAAEPPRPAARTLPANETTQQGIPLDRAEPPSPSPSQLAAGAHPPSPAPPVALAARSKPPEAYDDEIEEGIELDELADSEPPPPPDDGMDIDLREDPLGAVGAPRVLPPSPLGAAHTPSLLEVVSPERGQLEDAESAPAPSFTSLAPLSQTRSEPPGPIPSVIVQPSAPPTVGLAPGPAPAPSRVDEAAKEDGGSPILGALLVAATLMLAVGGWYLTRGGFTPTKPKPASQAPAAAGAPAQIAPAPPTPTPTASPSAAQVPPPPPQPLPPTAPGGTEDSPSGASTAPHAPEQGALSERERGRGSKLRPGSASAARIPSPAPAQPVAAPPAAAPVVTIEQRPPVIAIKPAASSSVAPGPAAPAPVVDPSSLPDTPSRDDVKRAFESVHAQLRGCSRGRGGVADVDLTVLSSGQVSFAKVGGDYAGTPEGSCMARAIRQARFSPFKRDKFRIIYPVAL